MNELFLTLGIEGWKPLLSSLLLPPLPLLLLVLVGARLMFRRRLLAWLLILLGVLGLWLGSTSAVGRGLTFWLTSPPPALSESDLAELKHAPRTAIVVLGGGRRVLAPEYGVSTLQPRSIERLRYGLWLARETGLPLGYSGGLAHGAEPGPTEAEIAARVAEREFGRPLRWQEAQSRDTHENAVKTVALLQPQGIARIVIVTHGYHMRRSLANFERAAAGLHMEFVPAPMGLPTGGALRASDWLPSVSGFEATRIAIHEWLGRLMGA
ncbi:MAG: YdcF family protein [Rubrivivax sp.]|nr:YdcF family protein [Rubrivivax sp.]